MSNDNATIVYTLTDESPLLATASLLPVIRAFTAAAGIRVVKSDISLAARILAAFPDRLSEEQRMPDALAELAALIQQPAANIIKLPNISASVNQLRTAIAELQSKGYPVPDYPEEARSAEERDIRARYAKVLGSAVNPVLREGNSDRRAPPAVKRFARKHPHSMGKWSPASRTHVAYMRGGDFYSSEKCMTLDRACDVRMDLVTKYGEEIVLKEKVALLDGEIIDSMFMSKKALCQFIEE
ncbi:MAG: NADP-dependent isocitrate dehydrogenase, partial [Gammaproteobacteria bacterium]|nr:NADP-dependent isocitrate dehydrogenase [Gammaproteobacteria bacterium]